MGSIIHSLPHGFRKLPHILRPRPLETGDVRRNAHRTDRRIGSARLGQQVPHYQDRMTHHVVQYPTALQLAHPEPRLMRPAVLLGGTSEIRAPSGGRAARPQNLMAYFNGWRKN